MATNNISPVPVRSQAVDSSGTMTQALISFLESLRKTAGEPAPVYAKASVPAAAGDTGRVIWISDATSGAWLYVSDGANWRDISTKAVLA